MSIPLVLGLNAVIVAVTDEVPRILTVKREKAQLTPIEREAIECILQNSDNPQYPKSPAELDALPFGSLDPTKDRTLELALRNWIREQTGIELGYVEQLYTFGDRNRAQPIQENGPRVVSVAYLALVLEELPSGNDDANWREIYDFLPWEDWRDGRPKSIEKEIYPVLEKWIASAPDTETQQTRKERADITFGLNASWDGDRVLERYELLYEMGLVFEAEYDHITQTILRKHNSPCHKDVPLSQEFLEDPQASFPQSRAMAFDHRRILSTALGRLRGKLKYRPVVFELLPETFTLFQIQRVVEALAGIRLHKQNFRRLVEKGGLVEATGEIDKRTGGRPAALFRFRREVLRERLAPGVGLPGKTGHST